MPEIISESLLTSPGCGYSKFEIMPTDTCQYYYECESCKRLLKPEAGNCCVFCSFSTVKCPPMQSRD